jgi:hypothetical protein
MDALLFGLGLLLAGILNGYLGFVVGQRHGAWKEWARHQKGPA